MKAYFGQEAREYQQINPKGFQKSFESYKRSLKSRIKTFEKHGRGSSSSAEKLREALYDVENAYTTAEKTSAFSKASFVLTSARGSYSRSRAVDKKIVQSLNEQFGTYDEKTGKIKPFIKLSELDEFGRMMEAAKEMSLDKIYGSSQIVQVIREVMDETKGTGESWRTLLNKKLGGLNT